LVNIYGAVKIYGLPLLILDYGTALTCDYVSDKGIFLGGLIIPGPEISLQALCERAALLPLIKFPTGTVPFLGRDTQAGMKAGILRGYGAMTDGLVERFQARYGRKFRVIATGGLAKAIAPYASRVDVLDPLLTLKSLVKVYKDHSVLPS
jgi:type III pantothenate kinase